MTIVHLAASPFFGGPERQMLGLATHLGPAYRSVYLSFAEGGLARPFLEQLQRHGVEAHALRHNAPHVRRCAAEVAEWLREVSARVLCCHGYKPDVIGVLAGRMAGVPVVAVSRGWTGATARVRAYEWLDRRCLRWMDRVVCVSEGQAAKVRSTGVSSDRVIVIRNAIDTSRFAAPDRSYRQRLQSLFKAPRQRIVCAAGRLSPEKGFNQLVEAARMVKQTNPGTGFVLFGDGPLREALQRQIEAAELCESFILAGFRDDVDHFLPQADLVILPSFTEGLPNVALEALAAGVPVVATAVGGTPEVVEHGISGYLVRPGDPQALARRAADVLRNEERRTAMGEAGRRRIEQSFTFRSQAASYEHLFDELAGSASRRVPASVTTTV